MHSMAMRATSKFQRRGDLRIIRRSMDLTQAEIAGLARCSTTTVCLTEKNRLPPAAQRRWAERIGRVLLALQEGEA